MRHLTLLQKGVSHEKINPCNKNGSPTKAAKNRRHKPCITNGYIHYPSVLLLVNSSTTAQPPNAKVIELPTSIAEKLPSETLTIMVSKNTIIVNGRAIVDSQTAMRSAGDSIPALQKELLYQAAKSPAVVNELGIAEREVTIMGDKSIPYKLLRKIMMTCSSAEFSKISLAVLKRPEDKTT